MSAARPVITLATSGLGNAYGGIGVVSEMIVDALAPVAKVAVWRNPMEHPRLVRRAMFALRSRTNADLVLYEHVDLARIHRHLPWLARRPYAVFVHGREVWHPLDRERRIALERASLLLTNSETTPRVARDRHPWFPEASVVWLGVVPPATSADASHDQPDVIIVGRINSTERQKGHDLLLDGWPLVRKRTPNARLRIIGDGDDRDRLERRARDEHLAGVEFLGRVGDAERDRIYGSSSVFAFPSRQEGFGLVAAEAAFHGLPIVALRGTVLEELFPEGTGGILTDADAPSIASAISSLLTDPQSARRHGEAARRRATDEFTAARFGERLRAALGRFLERRSGSHGML